MGLRQRLRTFLAVRQQKRLINLRKSQAVYIFGDSVVKGTGASSPAYRWTTVFCQRTSRTEYNYGVGGSTLQKQSPIDPLAGQNMVDRIAAIPVKTKTDLCLLFCFGINDWGVAAANYTLNNFKADYRTVLNAAIANGWSASNIYVLSPYYVTDSAFSFYNGINGGNTPNRSGLLAFIQAAANVAYEYGIQFINIYNLMEGVTTISSYISSDGVHPNDDGHNLIANLMNWCLSLPTAKSFNTDFNGDFR